MKEYKPRIADTLLDRKLSSSGAVLIEGAKWCGKTSTAEQKAKSFFYLSDNRSQNLEIAESSPDISLKGDTPRLIDEWQLAPNLWDAIRFEVDHRDDFAQFILTGSATPIDKNKLHHSGIGRISRLLMRPMSLYESGESNGSVSLKNLFEQKTDIYGTSELSTEDIAFLICRGGWPKASGQKGDTALDIAENYYEGLIESDISRVDNVKRNSVFASKILRSYARNIGQQVSLETIRNDVKTTDGTDLSIDTISSYISALRSIFVVEDSPSWNPNLRSSTAVRTSDTRYLVDPSIAATALGIGPEGLLTDFNTFGFLFECLAIRDLRVYAQALNGIVSHYRDSSGLECDAVIHLKDGQYGLVQIKIGATDTPIENAISKLQLFKEKLDPEKTPEPSFMMVLTGNGTYAYRRKEDGIYIVPIGTLCP